MDASRLGSSGPIGLSPNTMRAAPRIPRSDIEVGILQPIHPVLSLSGILPLQKAGVPLNYFAASQLVAKLARVGPQESKPGALMEI